MSDELQVLDNEQLGAVHGGNFFRSAWNVIKETFGYGGPSGASEAASAIEPAAKVAMLVPQANARNELIKTLANNGSSRAVDAAFDKYHHGPGQRLAAEVAK